MCAMADRHARDAPRTADMQEDGNARSVKSRQSIISNGSLPAANAFVFICCLIYDSLKGVHFLNKALKG